MGKEKWDNLEQKVREQVRSRLCHPQRSLWDDEQVDRYGHLRADTRVRSAIVTSIYEEYLPPGRHECEWELLNEIVRAVVASHELQFVAAATVAGLAGNGAWALLCYFCRCVRDELRGASARGESRTARLPDRENDGTALDAALQEMTDNTTALGHFFEGKPAARIAEIEEATAIPREMLYPLLKLGGLEHVRGGPEHCTWRLPQGP